MSQDPSGHTWRGSSSNEHCQSCRYGRDVVPPGPCTGAPICANCSRHLDDHGRTTNVVAEACQAFRRRHASTLHHALAVVGSRCDGSEGAEQALAEVRRVLHEALTVQGGLPAGVPTAPSPRTVTLADRDSTGEVYQLLSGDPERRKGNLVTARSTGAGVDVRSWYWSPLGECWLSDPESGIWLPTDAVVTLAAAIPVLLRQATE